MVISNNITYAEATKSQSAIRHGIDNTPNEVQLSNMKTVAEEVFEPLRKFYNTPIAITSFFRSVELNKKIKGSKTSQHCTGEAMDIDGDVFGKVTNKQIFDFIKSNLDFDQLIWEFGNDSNPDWVHVSYSKEKNRKEILRAKNLNGKTVYIKY